MEQNLLYSPALQPTREYYSDGAIEELIDKSTPTPEIAVTTTPIPIVATMQSNIKKLQAIANAVPVYPLIEDTVNVVANNVNNVITPPSYDPYDPNTDPDVYDPDIVPIPTYNLVSILDCTQEEIDATPNLPTLFSQISSVPVKTTYPKSLPEQVADAYNTDMADIHNDYINNMSSSFRDYLSGVLAVMSETGVSDFTTLTKPFDNNYANVTDPNLVHLADYITKSQIVRDQLQRSMNKVNSIDQTLYQLRAANVTYKQRMRYYTATYSGDDTYLNAQSNKLLLESRASYDQKYRDAMFNLYKYFNGSVINTGEILNLSLKEAQAKGKLLLAGVNILATAPVGTTVDITTSITAAVDQTSSSTATSTSSSSSSKNSTTTVSTGTTSKQK